MSAWAVVMADGGCCVSIAGDPSRRGFAALSGFEKNHIDEVRYKFRIALILRDCVSNRLEGRGR